MGVVHKEFTGHFMIAWSRSVTPFSIFTFIKFIIRPQIFAPQGHLFWTLPDIEDGPIYMDIKIFFPETIISVYSNLHSFTQLTVSTVLFVAYRGNKISEF